MKNPHWSHWLRTAGLWSLLLGWWLYRLPNHIKPLLITLMAGLVLGTLYGGDHMAILSREIWSRWVWGYSPNYLGLASGMGVLTLSVWLVHSRHDGLKVGQWLASVILLMILALMFISSGSRAAWVAFAFGLMVVWLFGILIANRKAFLVRSIATGLLILTVLGIVMLAQPDYIDGRLAHDREAVTKFLALEWVEAAEVRSPFGYRLGIWLRGLEAVLERPLLGWGSGSGSVLVYSDQLPFRHFHNIYLEVLVSFGLIGGALFVWVHYLLYRRTIAAWRAGVISKEFFIALSAITVFFLISMSSEIRIGQSEGRALVTVLYAFYVYALLRSGGHRNVE